MDFLATVVLVLVAGVLVLPIAAIVAVTRLRRRVDMLAADLRALRFTLDAAAPGAVDPGPAAARRPSAEAPAPETAPEAAPPTEREPAEAAAEPPVREPQIVLTMRGTAAAAAAPSGAMERKVGTQWTVWIGGLALALGAIFLVRYTIEEGLLGPGVRVILGWLFAAALIAAGEFLRRRELSAPIAGVPSAYVPGVLTAVGILSAFASTYAAYALYAFLPPPAAFILLAACALAALSASWLHGPGLAALGMVGSYATPALVGSEAPSAWSLFIYLLFVTGAAYFVARLRRWLWLALSGAAGAVAWGLLWCGGSWSEGDVVPLGVYVLGLVGLTYRLLLERPEPLDETEPPLLDGTDWPANGILAATTFLVLPGVRLDAYSTPALLFLAAAIAALLAGALRWRSLAALIPWSAILFGLVYLTWHIPAVLTAPIGPLDAYMGIAPIAPPGLWEFLATGAAFAGAFAAAGFLMSLRQPSHPFWTVVGASAPVAIFAYAYLRATNFEHSVPFGVLGLVLAGAYVAASDVMQRQGMARPWSWRAGCYAAAAVVALALAFTIVLEKGWLTIALALICPGLAWVAGRRPVFGLRYLAAGMAIVVILRLLYDPMIIGGNLGTTPIFNWLLYGYGLPAVAFVAAAWMFARERDDIPVQILEAAGLLCAVAMIGLQIRHLLNDGDIFADEMTLAELSIHSITWLGAAIGLQSVYDRLRRRTVEWASAILGMAALATVLFGHLLFKNPVFTHEPVDGPILNLLLLAYLVPAGLCGVLYFVAAGRRNELFVKTAGAAAFLLLFTYVTLETRYFFRGAVLDSGSLTDTESYAYSAVWLLYGAALLAGGIWWRLAVLRYASLAILILTVCKVFLYDMSNLSGILRALSFIGLGLVLVAIGYFYQRVVFPQGAEGADDRES